MIRFTLLIMLVAFLSCYAWRNWFITLCWSILLMAVVQHPDFPKSMGGIQGANPWNLLFLSVMLASWYERSKSQRKWDMPPVVNWMLVGYLLVVLIAVFRLLATDSGMPVKSVVSEFVINCIKWVLPGLFLFEGVRTRQRAVIAVGVIIALYFLLALQVINCMPLRYAISGEDLGARASKLTQSRVGYNRVTLSVMLAGACWAAVSALPLLKKNLHKLILLGVAGTIALGQALTAGRTGYITWGMVGLILAVVRWRKLIPILPCVAIAIAILLPGVRERMLMGFAKQEGNIVVQQSKYEMTSGRNIAWPLVIEKIGESPLIGYGKEAMTTTGLKDQLWEDRREAFPHPHQAYLEVLIDNGVVGFLIIIPFYLYCLRQGFRLLTDKNDPLNATVGGMAVSLILALMIGSLGGQTFYPREGSVGMWATIGLMLRMSVERNRLHAARRSLRRSRQVAQSSRRLVPN